MVELTTISRDELEHLRERAKNLAQEKSYLQLTIHLMNRISAAPGLENTIETMLKSVLDVIGATNIILYYRIDNSLFSTDVYGKRTLVERIDDALVQQVFDTRQPVEDEHAFADTRMLTAEFAKAYTWVFPLLVGPELIGVFKMENLIHIGSREWYQQLPAFFHYAALILKNEILGHTRLKQAYDQLSQANVELTEEVSERRRAEEELRKIKEELELRVTERTSELRETNELLQAELAERARAEETLHRLNRELRAISNCNQILVRAQDEQTLLNDICHIICDEAGYRMAWVGYAENDVGKTVRPVAWAGFESGHVANAKLTWAEDTERGRGPAGTAIRSGEILYVQDLATDPRMAPWRESLLQCGYRSGIALPLKDENAHVFGVLLIYSSEPNAVTPDEMRLLEELSDDLAFGITALRTRAERTRAEGALRESEERLQFALDAANEGLWDWQVKAGAAYLSPRFYTILGHEPYEFPGSYEAWISRVHSDDAGQAEQAMADYFAGRSPTYDTLVRMKRKDGRWIWMETHGKVVQRDEEGRPVRMVGTLADVTERERAEDDNRRLALVVESSDDAIIAKTLDGTILSWNAGAERLYGYAAEEAVGSSIAILVPPESVDELPQILARIRGGERVSHYETARIRKDGRRIQISLTISPLKDAHGNIIGASTIARDITESKRAADALRMANAYNRSLIEASLDPLVTIGPDGKITDVNKATEEATGCSRQELIGTDFSNYFSDPERARAGYRQVFREGQVRDYALDLRHRDGRVTSVLYHASLYRDEGGQVAGVFAAARDITERRRAEEEIRRLNQQLEQRVADRTAQLEASNKELEAFAYSVSHDLRAPLRHIDGFVDLLKKDAETVLDERSRHYLATIAESAKRMGTLIDDLLSFSRMGRQEMVKTPFDLGVLTREVIGELESETEGRDICWYIADLPVVRGDPSMLRLVLANLISNALKFTRPRRQAHIEIGCLPGEGRETVVFVRDNGVGFDAKYAGRLFGVFQRLHRVDQFEGTGIGLANVRRIIGRHGGRTWAEGSLDGGATFYFSLPHTLQGESS